MRAPLANDEPVQTVYADEPANPVIGELRLGPGVFDFTGLLLAGYGWDHGYLATGGYAFGGQWEAIEDWFFGMSFAGGIRDPPPHRRPGDHALRRHALVMDQLALAAAPPAGHSGRAALGSGA